MTDSIAGPTNLRFEVGVLGAALWSEQGATQVLDLARPSDFSDPGHRHLYEAMSRLAGQGLTPTIDLLEQQLRQDGTLERLGDGDTPGLAYLDLLHSNATLLSNLPHYVDLLRSCAGARQMIVVGRDLVNNGQSLSASDPEAISRSVSGAQELIWELADSTVPQTAEPISKIVEESYDEIRNGPADTEVIPTGFIDLDKACHGGLKPGQMVIVAARPAVGKSVFGLNCAAHSAIRKNLPAVFYSLEMSRVELATRLIAAEAGVPLDRIQDGMITEVDDTRIRDNIRSLVDAPLFIDDTPGLDLESLANSIRFMKRRHGIKLVVVDYLQLVEGAGDSRQEKVSSVSRKMKLVAKREQVAIIGIAQLNRGPEQRGGKPQISDLRESGSLEQDADKVILIHREDLYDADSDRKGEADFLLVKQRDGKTGTHPVAFLGHFSRFRDMPRQDY